MGRKPSGKNYGKCEAHILIYADNRDSCIYTNIPRNVEQAILDMIYNGETVGNILRKTHIAGIPNKIEWQPCIKSMYVGSNYRSCGRIGYQRYQRTSGQKKIDKETKRRNDNTYNDLKEENDVLTKKLKYIHDDVNWQNYRRSIGQI